MKVFALARRQLSLVICHEPRLSFNSRIVLHFFFFIKRRGQPVTSGGCRGQTRGQRRRRGAPRSTARCWTLTITEISFLPVATARHDMESTSLFFFRRYNFHDPVKRNEAFFLRLLHGSSYEHGAVSIKLCLSKAASQGRPGR